MTANNGHPRASSSNKSASPNGAASPNEAASPSEVASSNEALFPNEVASPNEVAAPTEVILITGAGGSIGSSLAKRLAGSKLDFANSGQSAISDRHLPAQHRCAPAWQDAARTLVLLDHSEQNLYEINSELSSIASNPPHLISILGNVNDDALLDELFDKYRPTTVFHAAAFKHVPLMEENPIAVIRNNVLGTWTLARAAIKHKARKLVMISTDKAANPRSIMGATKRIAELILSCLDSPQTRMSSIRLCNVLRSTGSVVPLFEKQIRIGGPVTITHTDASRYFISLQEATSLIFATAALDDGGTLFIPKLDAPVKIIDLARKMVAEAKDSNPREIKMAFTGLRPGEKLEEQLYSSSESVEPISESKLLKVRGSIPSVESLCFAIGVISEKIQSRDLPALIDVIRSLVPGYHPSDLISAQTSAQLSSTAKA